MTPMIFRPFAVTRGFMPNDQDHRPPLEGNAESPTQFPDAPDPQNCRVERRFGASVCSASSERWCFGNDPTIGADNVRGDGNTIRHCHYVPSFAESFRLSSVEIPVDKVPSTSFHFGKHDTDCFRTIRYVCRSSFLRLPTIRYVMCLFSFLRSAG